MRRYTPCETRAKGYTVGTTYTNQAPTLVDVDFKVKSYDATLRSAIALIDTQLSDTGLSVARYIYNSGSAADPVSFQAREIYDKKMNWTTNQMVYQTLVRATTSETGAVVDYALPVMIQWGHPDKTPKSTQFVVDNLGAAFGFVARALTGANGYATTGVIDAFARGVLTQGIFN